MEELLAQMWVRLDKAIGGKDGDGVAGGINIARIEQRLRDKDSLPGGMEGAASAIEGSDGFLAEARKPSNS